jgi:hypothetical protein
MSHLSAFILGGALQTVPLIRDVYRKYFTTLTSHAVINGLSDVSSKVIMFKVGARFDYTPTYDSSSVTAEWQRIIQADPGAYEGSKKRNELMKRLVRKARRLDEDAKEPIHPAMNPPSPNTSRIQQPFTVADGIAAGFASAARKYTGLTGNFAIADMSSLVERLIKGIAHYAASGDITMADLAGGRDINITAAGNHTTPLCASDTSVWLPRSLDSIITPNVVAAIAAACAAIGSTLVTDTVAVTGDNSPIIPTATGSDLVEGCYHALRIIGGNMEHNRAGPLFAYAVTHGVHNQVSVVGMTDEGAYLRSVLRTTAFTPSYGGISGAHTEWNAFPRPPSTAVAGWASFIDSIALLTAACVAVADPCMNVGGRTYPTVYSGVNSKRGHAGSEVPGDENDSAAIAAKIMSSVPAFAANYARILTTAFSMTEGDNTGGVITHLTTSFASGSLANDRHLKYPSVAPFYWIEPTGPVTFDTSSYVATKNGFGPLTTPAQQTTLPLFEDVQVVESLGDVSEINIAWRSARTSGLAVHLGSHILDGLANIKVVGGDCEAWIHPGGPSKDMSARLDSGDDMASYLWKRGDVAVPAPSEAVYLGTGLACVSRHRNMDTSSWLITETHFPQVGELTGGVALTVGKLVAHQSGERGPTASARRNYTVALKALDAARVTATMRSTTMIGRIRNYDITLTPKATLPQTDVVTVAPNVVKSDVIKGDPASAKHDATAIIGPQQPLVYIAGPKTVAGPPASTTVARSAPGTAVLTQPLGEAADLGAGTQ